jgi:hypothetical protein
MEEADYSRKAATQDQPDQEDQSADEEEDDDSADSEAEGRRPARKKGKSAATEDYKSKPRRKASQKPVVSGTLWASIGVKFIESIEASCRGLADVDEINARKEVDRRT